MTGLNTCASVPHGIDIARLGAWIRSWIQPDGAIHGFHNHSVWGMNPYRAGDFTAGHSTWASPFLPGLARAVSIFPDDRAEALLRRLVAFQTGAFQADGNYAHIGFQMGEQLKVGLIHNAIANVSLVETALLAPDVLGEAGVDQIRSAYERNTAAHGRIGSHFTTNQEYTRNWGKLLFAQRFDRPALRDEALEDLRHLIHRAHVYDLPEPAAAGTIRHPGKPNALEPAEYYGLMVHPLVLAFESTGEELFLDAAEALCRHVVASAWTDPAGCLRLHRTWTKLDGAWIRTCEPMLISGMGDTVAGLRVLLRHRPDSALERTADAFDRTYAHYQHPAGFFAAASGWHAEPDIVPASAWHAHDWHYLVTRTPIDAAFWETFWRDASRVAVVLGLNGLWVEDGPHWSIGDYAGQGLYKQLGRKDRVRFGYDLDWVGGPNKLPDEYTFDLPVFFRGDDGIRLTEGNPDQLLIINRSGLPLVS